MRNRIKSESKKLEKIPLLQLGKLLLLKLFLLKDLFETISRKLQIGAEYRCIPKLLNKQIKSIKLQVKLA